MSMGGGGNRGGGARDRSSGGPRARGRATVVLVAGVALAAALVLTLTFVGGSGESRSGNSGSGESGSGESRSGEDEGFNPAMSGGEVTGSGARADEDGDSSTGPSGDGSESREVSGEREGPEREADHDEEYVALTESQRGRARLAAVDFILAAYGYPKDDWARYSEQIRPEVEWGVFYESAAGEEINRRIDSMREGEDSGLEGAVVVERFEVLEVDENEGSGESEEVSAEAYFEAAGSFSPEGEAEGRSTYYRQKMTLTTDGETYLVRAAEVPVKWL